MGPWTIEHRRVFQTCGDCGWTYQVGRHWHARCFRCNPGDPTPLGVLLTDSEAHMGPDWVWMPSRGLRGQWWPRRELVVVDRVEFDEAWETIKEYVPPALLDQISGLTFTGVLKKLLPALAAWR